MGTQNRVTEAKYKEIKTFVTAQARKGKMMKQIDDEVEKKFGFKQSTSQNIRRTGNYQEYCERVFRFHGNPKKDIASKSNAKVVGKISKDSNPNIIVLSSASENKPDYFGRILALFVGVAFIAACAVVVALLWRAYVS